MDTILAECAETNPLTTFTNVVGSNIVPLKQSKSCLEKEGDSQKGNCGSFWHPLIAF